MFRRVYVNTTFFWYPGTFQKIMHRKMHVFKLQNTSNTTRIFCLSENGLAPVICGPPQWCERWLTKTPWILVRYLRTINQFVKLELLELFAYHKPVREIGETCGPQLRDFVAGPHDLSIFPPEFPSRAWTPWMFTWPWLGHVTPKKNGDILRGLPSGNLSNSYWKWP